MATICEMGGEVLNLSSQGVGSLADVPLSGSTGTLVLSNNGLMALDGVVEDQPAVRKVRASPRLRGLPRSRTPHATAGMGI